MMTKEGSTKIVNFMNPGTGVFVLERGHISHKVKLHYLFKNSSSLLPGIDQTSQDQGRVYQNCKFKTERERERERERALQTLINLRERERGENILWHVY